MGLRQLSCSFAILFLVFSVGVSSGVASTRIALVIGNGHYKNTPALDNPGNDAQDIANELTAIGFAVTLKIDAGKRELDQAIEQFARDAKNADAALFYFAGHGMQFQGRNYIMPVDAELRDEISLKYELTAIDDVKSALLQSRGVKILILDSCRNNPLAQKFARSITVATRDVPNVQGFARAEQTGGMIIVYSTQADEVANDGVGRNSPFSAALLKELKEPGLEIGALFRRVEEDVFKATNGQQSPELSISMVPEFYLNQAETDQAIWARIRLSADGATLKEFISRYPNSFYAPDAEARLEALERAASDQATAAKAMQAAQDAAAEVARLKQLQADRDNAAAQADQRQQQLADKLAAAEAERVKLTDELAKLQSAQIQADEQQRDDRARQDAMRAQQEATLRDQIAKLQVSDAEKQRQLQDALDEERARQASADQAAAARDQAAKAEADNAAKTAEERTQALKAEIAQLEQQAAQARADAAAAAQRASDAGKAVDAAEVKVASVAPTAPISTQAASDASPTAADPQTLASVRAELHRVGCYSGAALEWDAPEMKLGVAKYVRYAKLTATPAGPDAALLAELKQRPAGFCPPECSAREVVVDGRCVTKACGAGQILTRVGVCIPKPASHRVVAKAAPATAAKAKCFTFNAAQYCE